MLPYVCLFGVILPAERRPVGYDGNVHTRSMILVSVVIAVVLGVAVSVFLHEHSEASSAMKKPSITIVLDAGHGGKDPGAVVAGVKEKDVDLAVAKRVFSLAKEDDRLNPMMTRNADIYIALGDRAQLADEVDAALYLSIQANACDCPDVEGIETWVDEIHSPGDPSWQLAEILQSSVVEMTGARDRGVRSQELYLHSTKRPAALVEIGFLTSKEERNKLTDPVYQGMVAQGIFEGIVAYLSHIDRYFSHP